jgi:hypothetical protein
MVDMFGGLVAWSSKDQFPIAASTMDAEYPAYGSVTRGGLSLIKAHCGELSWL